MSDLRPCPFCGGEARVAPYQDEDLWSHNVVTWTEVRCDECDVGFAWPPGAEPDAIAQWNTRALPTPDDLRRLADHLNRTGRVVNLPAHHGIPRADGTDYPLSYVLDRLAKAMEAADDG